MPMMIHKLLAPPVAKVIWMAQAGCSPRGHSAEGAADDVHVGAHGSELAGDGHLSVGKHQPMTTSSRWPGTRPITGMPPSHSPIFLGWPPFSIALPKAPESAG